MCLLRNFSSDSPGRSIDVSVAAEVIEVEGIHIGAMVSHPISAMRGAASAINTASAISTASNSPAAMSNAPLHAL